MKRYDEKKREELYGMELKKYWGQWSKKHAFSVKVKITMGVKSGLGEAEK